VSTADGAGRLVLPERRTRCEVDGLNDMCTVAHEPAERLEHLLCLGANVAGRSNEGRRVDEAVPKDATRDLHLPPRLGIDEAVDDDGADGRLVGSCRGECIASRRLKRFVFVESFGSDVLNNVSRALQVLRHKACPHGSGIRMGGGDHNRAVHVGYRVAVKRGSNVG